LRSYSKAATRSAKSAVISDIVSSIRASSTQEGGGFVRFNASHCRWYEVGDKVARDKVGQALRDCIRARGKKGEPYPTSESRVQYSFRPEKEKIKVFKLSSVEHIDTINSMSYTSTAVTEQPETAPPRKRSTSIVTLKSASNGLTMLFHEIAGMDGKPCSTDAWDPAESLFEWFERDMQGVVL
jgi:hypothetical protein